GGHELAPEGVVRDHDLTSEGGRIVLSRGLQGEQKLRQAADRLGSVLESFRLQSARGGAAQGVVGDVQQAAGHAPQVAPQLSAAEKYGYAQSTVRPNASPCHRDRSYVENSGSRNGSSTLPGPGDAFLITYINSFRARHP